MVDLDSSSSTTDLLSDPQQISGSPAATVLLLGILLVALTIIVGALDAGVRTLLSVVRELVAQLMAQLGRLLLIGLCLVQGDRQSRVGTFWLVIPVGREC